MNMMESIKAVYGNYAKFSGRATRSEFWWFVLFYVIVYVILGALSGVYSASGEPNMLFGILLLIFVLGTIVPYLAVGARRLHDIGKSGWWQLIAIIPLVGLVLIYFWAQKSQEGSNQYG